MLSVLRQRILCRPGLTHNGMWRLLSGLLLLLATFCLFSPAVSQAAEARTIRTWAFDFPPGIFMGRDGAVQGWFVDLLDEIGRQENLRFTFEHGSWAEGLERASHDQIDLLTSVAWSAERTAFLDYGKVPILTVWAELYSREDATITRLDQLEGLTVAVMRQDYNARTFREKFDRPVTYLECDSFDEVFLAVESRRADVGVVSRLVAEYRARSYRVRHTGISVNPFDIFFATPKGHDPVLLATLDRYLDAWRKQENSFYYTSHHQWRSPSEPTALERIPGWVWKALTIALAFTAFATLWIVVLRRQVRTATADLRRKNIEMERFLYAASHDLKTPLVTIKNFLGFLTIDLQAGDHERVIESTGYIARAADRMSLLLDELLAYARIGYLDEQDEEICAGDLPRHALVELQDDISSRNVRAVVTDLDITLKGSRRRLAEIWRNLLENAINHLGNQPAPLIEVGRVAIEGETRFYVRDNGIGIDARYHQKIFGLFERLDANAPGAGLGLALVKQVVEHYDGRIWVESAGEGQGSCFWFTLPKAVINK